MLEGADAADGREILDRVIARLLQQEHVVPVRLVVAEDEGVTIRLGLGDRAGTDGARGAGPVVDDDVLAD